MRPLDPLLSPRSLALVGASEASLWSQNLVANLRGLGYSGVLSFVHPRERQLFGEPAHASLEEVPGEVDCAWVMTGTAAALDVVESAGRKGVRGMVMLTAGFREAGQPGAILERRLVDRCRELGIQLQGPNCLGFVNYQERVAAYGLLMQPPLLPGGIGIVSQSGAMLLQFHRMAMQRAIGLSYLVSIGNEAMNTSADFLRHFAEDPPTRVLGALLEGIRDPQAFLALAELALEVGKPLVVLKVGRNEAAVRSASAHTGSLAGADAVVDAVFQQRGVIRVAGMEELLETCALLASAGWPKGGRTAVVTTSGGACGIISDLADGTSIEIPDFKPETKAELARLLPVFGNPQNPLDTTGVIVDQPGLLAACVETVLEEGGFDALLINTDPPREPGPHPERTAGRVEALADTLHRTELYSAVSATAASELTDYGRSLLLKNRIHFANGLTLGVKAFEHAVDYGRRRLRPAPLVRAAGDRHPPPLVDGWTGTVPERDGKRLLEAYGVPIPPEWLAKTAAEAADAAVQIGFPVVLKVQSPDIPHKTEAGGVRLGLESAESVLAAFEEVVAGALAHSPGARLDGVLVAAQVEPVVELIAGLAVDPQFGPVVVAGIGGIFVEVMKDVQLRLPPLDLEEATSMLDGLRGAPLLRGARGRPEADVAAAAAALVALGELALDLGDRLVALDVNPLFVLPEGRGVLAGDALLELR